MKKVFLAGEGANELGSWAKKPPYQDDSESGVLKALLQKIKNDGWQVSGAIRWKNIIKFQAGHHMGHEERNVLGACLRAIEKNCSIIAFSRDADADESRQERIGKGIKAAYERFNTKIGIIGGCAVPCIEGWILAFLGMTQTEEFASSKACDSLKREVGNEPNTKQMVQIIARTDMKNIAHDARALKEWLKTAQHIL